MKRITKIQLENSRAYYNQLTFNMPKGENLLLYGANGSGKTSLYKALNDFIQSFYSQVEYTKNWYKPDSALGIVTLNIGEYNPVTKEVKNGVNLSFTDRSDNTKVVDTAYLKALALSKGFLNYRDLLKVYLYEENNPNLFDFFVLKLLKNYVPLAQGWHNSLQEEWEELNRDVFEVYTRRDVKHRRGLSRLSDFETGLRAVLTALFENVNKYLAEYFSNFSLVIDYQLAPMTFNYGKSKAKWEIYQDLRLKIELGHSLISGYTDGLNEARLSAIAICLYLSALRANPGSDMRFMFLDDIFIGIDSVNRLPILEILNKEFDDFQIIIATYDRSWYCMAKNHINHHVPERWKFCNLFSLPKNEGGQTFMVPVITDTTSLYDRAKEYLHGQRDIDLPAAANYFRKALEELFCETHLPKELFLNDDYTPVPCFKLTQRVGAVARLFDQIGEDTRAINIINSYLHPLIHPLSHYDEEAQIYRSEMIKVENAIEELYNQIKNFSNKCKLFLGKGNKIEIHYATANGSYQSKYHIIFEENVWLYKDVIGNPKFTDSKCRAIYLEGMENGIRLKPFHPTDRMKQFCYISINDALKKIYEYEVNVVHHAVVTHNDYDIVYRCMNNELEPIAVKRDALLAAMP